MYKTQKKVMHPVVHGFFREVISMGKKQNFEDDGRTIANMNVEGMPWYNPGKGKTTGGSKNQDLSELTPSETRAMIGGVLKAALSSK